MLQDFPLNLQVRVMSFLDHGEVYQACLISRGLNEAATRVLYMEPIWSVGCCEEEDDAQSKLDAAFSQRPDLTTFAKGLTLLAGRAEHRLPPLMPNLRRLEFISCPRCERGWEDASIMSLLRHFYNPSAPKEVSIHGLVVHSDGMEGLGGIGFLEVGSLDEDRGPWSYMRRNMLTSLDIKAAGSAFLNNSFNMKHLRTLSLREIKYMEPMLLGIKDLRTLEELTMECSVWSQELPPEQWDLLTCDLPSLRMIHLGTGQYFIGEVAFQRLCDLFQCITPRSLNLENVHLGSTPPRLNPPFSGEALVQGIMDRNKNSLHSLRVSAAFLPAHVLVQLLTECPLLHELHISGSRSDLYTIALLVSRTAALCDFHFGLDLPAALSDPYPAIEEIITAANSLRQLIVYIPTEYKWGRDVVWKWSWEYDKSQAAATRVTTGPVTRDIERGHMPRTHDASHDDRIQDNAMEIDEPTHVGPTQSLKRSADTNMVKSSTAAAQRVGDVILD